jgi:hypothetical protein
MYAMGEPAAVYGLDIETDNADGAGLDPAAAAVISVALTVPSGHPLPAGVIRHHSSAGGGREVAVLDHSRLTEVEMLQALDQLVGSLPSGVIATWNGAAFDMPFLADRAHRNDMTLALTLRPAPHLECKYGPLPGHTGAYDAEWGSHHHVDVCYAGRSWCASLDVVWSLKPLASAVGLEPVKEDGAGLHNIDDERRIAYVGSDAAITAALAEMMTTPGTSGPPR